LPIVEKLGNAFVTPSPICFLLSPIYEQIVNLKNF
jgi:hypothetical protein